MSFKLLYYFSSDNKPEMNEYDFDGSNFIKTLEQTHFT